jgi:iduronate 2-sulfatase
MILHKDGFVELYDQTTIEKQTKNITALNPELVARLKQELVAKLK